MRTIRPVVMAVCVVGIAGMIATSVTDSTGGALAFGLLTAGAVLCLVVASAVAAGDAPADLETQAARVEALVGEVVAAGADEHTVRRLAGEAVRLGRGLPPDGAPHA